jgi:hypothetical protein
MNFLFNRKTVVHPCETEKVRDWMKKEMGLTRKAVFSIEKQNIQ